MKTWNKLMSIHGYNNRLEYLMINQNVGERTFGAYRSLNQTFYKSSKWLSTRDQVIIRDKGCDLGIDGFDIIGPIYVHHIEPITIDDLINDSRKLYDLNNLVCTSRETHEAIHYGYSLNNPMNNYIVPVRTEGDTCLW